MSIEKRIPGQRMHDINTLIQSSIHLINPVDYSNNFSILSVIGPPEMKQRMKSKHAQNMRKLVNPTTSVSSTFSIPNRQRPILLIVDPFTLFVDPIPVTLDYDLSLHNEGIPEFHEMVRKYNQHTLRMAVLSLESDMEPFRVLIFRRKLMSFISWIHRLSETDGVAIEVLAYSDRLQDELVMIYLVNLIQIYYNMFTRKETDIDKQTEFTFIGMMTCRLLSKSLSGFVCFIHFVVLIYNMYSLSIDIFGRNEITY